MNFIVSSGALLKQLQKIGGVLNSSNTVPILDNFLFEITNSELTITASDLETTMSVNMPVDAKEDVSIAIPAKTLVDTLKQLPDHPITFTINKDNFGVEFVSDFGKYGIVGHNGDEFPKSPVIENAASIELPNDVLLKAINKTLFATGNDELRPVMSGVYCEFDSNHISFVATDAHKLVRFKRSDITTEGSSSFILPKKPLGLLKNSSSNNEEIVKVQYNESNAIFTFDNTRLVCRLIDGKYPNYDAVIPKDNPNLLTINKGDFLSSLKRVGIFSNKTTHQIRLKISGSELQLSAEDLDFANKANERLTCTYEGSDMEIGFNSRFLIEMIANIDAEEINIELSAPNRAGILLPKEQDNEQEHILMLVMPVMLNN